MLKFSLLFFSLLSSAFCCSLNSDVISLSGSMTSQLFELGLQKDKKLIAISEFYPNSSKYMQKKISGGIYLPVKELQNIVMETVLFLDESADLEKMGKQVSQLNPKIKSIMIKTRGKRSWDVVSEIHELIKKYSTGCEAAMARVDEKVKSYRLKIESYPEKKIIFFLGEIKEGQALPMKVIVGDLFIGDLLSLNRIKTYPSEVEYVDWSQKILNSLSDYQYVGLSLDEVKDEKNNFFHPKIFIPGLDQVEVFTLFSLFALPAK